MRAARIMLWVALPFLLLIRGSLVSHRFLGAPGWIAVLLGTILSTACLAVLLVGLARRLGRRPPPNRTAFWVSLPLTVAFLIYSLGWISHANSKGEVVAAHWRELHPTLRLAIGTTRLADRHFVVTDISRKETDYDRMGLPRARKSRHYLQRDGWIHAVDLRTRGRNEARNGLLWIYFWSMGFDVLRHEGTADHLHVALPSA